ncbi:GNAT family N-acetyltransferase [Flammeovirgaceae bacterium SG7u.111]|nr:GNAT family N-acetyltransferase [Flammeovirgaceae bacterium SG7u.132]WPO35285.1 GNAT family N-acetyltransferase [Flammeovirgaceae bacterium SG7u.111]
MIVVKLYSKENKVVWDKLVAEANGATFILKRDFIEYHQHRFDDYSLTVWNQEKLIAVLPANISKLNIYSHQGLSYGGMVFENGISAQLAYHAFISSLFYLKERGFEKLIYKQLPSYYHISPALYDQYPLFCTNAKLTLREMSQIIDLQNSGEIQKRRLRGVKKAQKQGIIWKVSENWEDFWEVLSGNLQERYGKEPVHSLKEILYLKKLFPDHIKLYVAKKKGEILGGTVIFQHQKTAHAQYIASTAEGKASNALDFLFFHLIKHYEGFNYFSFGVSNTRNGFEIDKGLFEWKEGWGTIPWQHDIYEINLQPLPQELKNSSEIFNSLNKK